VTATTKAAARFGPGYAQQQSETEGDAHTECCSHHSHRDNPPLTDFDDVTIARTVPFPARGPGGALPLVAGPSAISAGPDANAPLLCGDCSGLANGKTRAAIRHQPSIAADNFACGKGNPNVRAPPDLPTRKQAAPACLVKMLRERTEQFACR
jgi:hypothetical protein